ncbi:hypothetical protein [Nonomuraea sp. NPDC049400]|uniref:hypothetical protein n=1 Tax=Nonomuraea sp. NPDC049400 TaxID=3364352 RepID=UPI0037A1B816
MRRTDRGDRPGEISELRPGPTPTPSCPVQPSGSSTSFNLLYRYITQGRVEADRLPISPRRLARLVLTQPGNLKDEHRRLLDDLTTACPEMIDLAFEPDPLK